MMCVHIKSKKRIEISLSVESFSLSPYFCRDVHDSVNIQVNTEYDISDDDDVYTVGWLQQFKSLYNFFLQKKMCKHFLPFDMNASHVLTPIIQHKKVIFNVFHHWGTSVSISVVVWGKNCKVACVFCIYFYFRLLGWEEERREKWKVHYDDDDDDDEVK